jgi:hypothetical protein
VTRVAVLVVAAGSLLAAGCGANASVSGRVTHKGKPLPAGTVTFLTADNKIFTSQITSDGTFTVPQLTAGTVKIGVQTPPPQPADDSQAPRPSDAPTPPPPVILPAKYADPNASGLTLTVTGGSQTHNIELP